MMNETQCCNRDEVNNRIQALTSKFTSGTSLENMMGRSFGTRKFKNIIHETSKGFKQQILQDIENDRSVVRNQNIDIEKNTYANEDLEENIEKIEEKVIKIKEVSDLLTEGNYPLKM